MESRKNDSLGILALFLLLAVLVCSQLLKWLTGGGTVLKIFSCAGYSLAILTGVLSAVHSAKLRRQGAETGDGKEGAVAVFIGLYLLLTSIV
ncbi:MAG: hypothetical protein K6F23_12095 [Solobacterium sp.]|nr:hypothetical protein [Solobacterium sp.]